MNDLSFYKGKRVFVTGHTGFKGTWLCQMLVGAGAQVTGYSLQPPTDPSLFALSGLENRMNSMIKVKGIICWQPSVRQSPRSFCIWLPSPLCAKAIARPVKPTKPM